MSERHDKKRATMLNNIEVQTGKPISGWVEEIDAANLTGFSAVVEWLKSEHRFGHFQARLVAEVHRDRGT